MKWGFGIRIIFVLSTLLVPAISAAGDDPNPETAPSVDRVDGKGIGIAGGAIAGAEVVVAVQAIFGVSKRWPYFTIPLLGAAGGGIGGYFLEKKAPPQASVGLFVGSIALLIPTLLAASAATSYNPEDEGTVDNSPAFSFEPPTSESLSEEPTTTEIESRPEGEPGIADPPPEGGPPEPAASPEETGANPPETNDISAAPETDDKDAATVSRQRAEHERQLAQIRRATAGALFFVDRDGSAGLSVPHLGIEPTTISSRFSLQPPRHGIMVMFPLLKVNLP